MRRELAADTSLKTVFGIMFVLALFMAAFSTGASGGLLSHAASGRVISENGMMSTESFSYALPETAYDGSNWMFDLFAYSTIKVFGPGAAFIPLFIFFICLSAVMFMTLHKKQEGKYLSVTMPLAVFGLLLLSPYRGLNASFMSVLFCAFFIFCLTFEPKKKNMVLWMLLPLIALIWTNMHRSGSLAVLIQLIFTAFYAVEASQVYEKQKLYNMKAAWISLLVTLLVSFLKPGGAAAVAGFYRSVIMLPFHTGHVYQGARHILWYVFFYLYCLAGFVVFIYSTRGHGTDIGRKGYEVRDAMLYLVLLVLALRDASFIPVFMAVSIPFVAYYSFLIFRWDYAWPRKMTEIQLINMKLPVYITMSSLLAAFAIMLMFVPRPSYPVQSSSYILKNPVPLNMFTPYSWGSYTEYALYPAYRVLASERNGADASVSREAIALEKIFEGWRDTISKFGINSFLLPRRSALGAILVNEGYAPVYFNDSEIIYVNTAMPAKVLMTFNPDMEPGFDRKYAKKAFEEASAFAEAWPTASSVAAAAKILKVYSMGDAIDYLQDQIETNPGIREIKLELARTYLENAEFENAIESAMSYVPPSAESARIAAEARKKMVRREEIQ